LLADANVASLEKPFDGVGMRVQQCWHGESLENLYLDEVLLDTTINNGV
jgi:hypothetical protein